MDFKLKKINKLQRLLLAYSSPKIGSESIHEYTESAKRSKEIEKNQIR